jgi:hypothetical protein
MTWCSKKALGQLYVYPVTFPSPVDVHIVIVIIIKVFQSCNPIWNFNPMLFFDLSII